MESRDPLDVSTPASAAPGVGAKRPYEASSSESVVSFAADSVAGSYTQGSVSASVANSVLGPDGKRPPKPSSLSSAYVIFLLSFSPPNIFFVSLLCQAHGRTEYLPCALQRLSSARYRCLCRGACSRVACRDLLIRTIILTKFTTPDNLLQCKRLKLKCDRRTPCGSCTKRDTVPRCIYSQAAAEKVYVV